MLRLRDLLTELEERIGPLKIQSEKAEKFLVLSDERKGLEIGLWLYAIEKLKDDLRAQEDALAIAAQQYDDSESQLRALEQQSEQALLKAQQITVTIDDIRTRIATLEEEAAQFDAQAAVLQNSVQHNEETIDRIERDKAATGETREQLQKEIDSENVLIAQIKTIQAEKQSALDAARQELLDLGTSGGSLDEETEKVNTRLSALAQQAADARVAAWSAQTAMREMEDRKASITQMLSQQEETLSQLQTQKQNADQTLKTALQNLNDAQNVVSALQMKADLRTEKADKLKLELDDLSFELQRSMSKLKMLEDLEKNMDGYSGAVKAVITGTREFKEITMPSQSKQRWATLFSTLFAIHNRMQRLPSDI